MTHVDGSARVQVLERSMAPRLHALLEAYGRRRGIPVLLKTSFNVAGEPIVNAAFSRTRRTDALGDVEDQELIAALGQLETTPSSFTEPMKQ